jgi:hypothetical protein
MRINGRLHASSNMAGGYIYRTLVSALCPLDARRSLPCTTDIWDFAMGRSGMGAWGYFTSFL